MDGRLLKLYLGVVLFTIPVAALRTLRPEVISSIAGFAIFFVLTIVLLKKIEWKSPLVVMWVILLGIATIELFPRLEDFDSGQMSLPDSLCRLFGAVGGYLFIIIHNKILKTAFTLFLTVGIVWFSTTGTGLWINKVCFGTYTGFVDETIREPLEFFNSDGDTLRLADFKADYIVLMAWHSDCGACVGDLLPLQKLYDQYKDNSEVKIFSCLCMLPGDDYNTASVIAKQLGLTLPNVSVLENSPIDRIVGSSHYYYTPMYLILDKNGTLLYKTGKYRIEKIVRRLTDQ